MERRAKLSHKIFSIAMTLILVMGLSPFSRVAYAETPEEVTTNGQPASGAEQSGKPEVNFNMTVQDGEDPAVLVAAETAISDLETALGTTDGPSWEQVIRAARTYQVAAGSELSDTYTARLKAVAAKLAQLADDLADVRLLTGFLQALGDDVDGLVLLPVLVYACDVVDIGLELGKHRLTQNLKTLARLVVFICRLLGREDRRVAGKTVLP